MFPYCPYVISFLFASILFECGKANILYNRFIIYKFIFVNSWICVLTLINQELESDTTLTQPLHIKFNVLSF